MVKAVYPGSFDPITLGHIDIIQRIQKLFDHVTILVSNSPNKKSLFTAEERKVFIEKSLPSLNNIDIKIFEGLTVDYLKSIDASVIVRGMRAVVDFEFEMTMANLNKKLASDIETLMVFASPEYYYISSRGVKEIATFGGKLEGLVPSHVIQPLYDHLSREPSN